jgi:protein-L-isoaspartate(D-aspartate) O-methyltransferase
MVDLEDARERMVQRQVARRGVRDKRVLEALRETPRELFVPEGLREFAYDDSPLPIEAGQTISQPYIVGLMAAAAAIQPEDRVLEIGTGSGYAAAVLARLADQVHTVERHETLAITARERLKGFSLNNVDVHLGDGTHGWPDAAPYDAILVAAGGPAIPQALKDQLELGGRLVVPVGQRRGEQRLIRVTRTGANHFEEDDLGGVTFVPLIGEHGWSDARRWRALRRGAQLPAGRAGQDDGEPDRRGGRVAARFRRSGLRRPVRPFRRQARGAAG